MTPFRGPLRLRRSAEHTGRFDVFQDGVQLVDAAPDKFTAIRWAQDVIDKRRAESQQEAES